MKQRVHELDSLADDVLLYLMNFVDHKDLFNTIPLINCRFYQILNRSQEWWRYFYHHRFNIAQDTVPTYGDWKLTNQVWKDLCRLRYLEDERWDKGSHTNSQILSHGYGTISCIKLVNHVHENEHTEYILSGCSDRQIRIWKNIVSLDSDCNWTLKQSLRGHFDTITCIETVSYKNSFEILSASLDGTCKLWTPDEKLFFTCTKTFEGHTDWIKVIKLCALDNMYFVSGSRDKDVRVWSRNSGLCLHTLSGHTATVWCLEDVSNVFDDSVIVSGGGDGFLKLWNWKTGKCIDSIKAHSDVISACKQVGESPLIVTSSFDKHTKVWDLRKRDKPLKDMAHSKGIYSIDLENDKLVCCTLDGYLTMWNIHTGECIQQFVSPRLLKDLLGITQRRTTIEGNRSCTVKFNREKVLCNNDISSSVVYWNAKYSIPITSFRTANNTEAQVASFEIDRRKIVAAINSVPRSYLHVWHFNPKREKRQ